MATKIRMPRLDANADAASIARWLVAPGDAVSAGQPIVEIATDKATYEFEAECGGLMRWQAPAAEAALPVGYVIALLADSTGEALPDVAAENEACMAAFRDSPLAPGFAEDYGPSAGGADAGRAREAGSPPGQASEAGVAAEPACLVPLQTAGQGAPLFFITPGRAGHLRALAGHLGSDRPFYALHAFGTVDPEAPRVDIPDLARTYVAAIRSVQPQGSYLVAGVSSGGVVALEAAHQLRRAGQDVGLLAIIDALYRPTLLRPFGGFLGVLRRQPARLRSLRDARPGEWVDAVRAFASAAWRARGLGSRAGAAGRGLPGNPRRRNRRTLVRLVDAHRAAAGRYRKVPFPGSIVYFWSTDSWFLARRDPRAGWDELALGGFVVREVPGYHHEVLEEPHVRVLAAELRRCIPRPS